MKKLFFTMVVILMSTALSYAQNTLVATLSHGDNITMYYGVNALSEAYKAAQSGDVIMLSGGTFNAVNIAKAVTIRGTGIDAIFPTCVTNNFTINIPANDTNRLSLEGIDFKGTITTKGSSTNFLCLKSRIATLNWQTQASSEIEKTALFIHCKLTKLFELKGTNTVCFINSSITDFWGSSSYTASAQFINCVLYGYPSEYHNSTFINSIMFGMNGGHKIYEGDAVLPAECMAMNCVTFFACKDGYASINDASYGPYSELQGGSINCMTSTLGIFKRFIEFDGDQSFELTDEAQSMYLGTDGTQVGMYGGDNPYNPTPTYPRITKMNVASKTTPDGKLSVEIEVSASE